MLRSECVTTRELLATIRYHWSDVYEITVANGRYTATAKYGQRDVLAASDPEELLGKIRRHYRRPPEERSST
jgi:hypothetical protein